MPYFNSQGKEIPDHLWELGNAVRKLIEQYNAMDLWRRHVRAWVKGVREAKGEPNFPGIVSMDLPFEMKNIDEKYAVLAAVHDNCARPDRNEELIDPWSAEAAKVFGPEKVRVNPEALDAISTYGVLMGYVLAEEGWGGIERSKSGQLLEILRDVTQDVRSVTKLWTPDRPSIRTDEPALDPGEEYATFLRRDSESEDVRSEFTATTPKLPKPECNLLPRPGKTMPKKPAEHPQWLEWQNAICDFTNASRFSVRDCWGTHNAALQDIAGVIDFDEFAKIHKQHRERLRQNKKK